MTPLILLSFAALAATPTPPPTLEQWLDYARAVTDEDPKCPPDHDCVQLQRVEIAGEAQSGSLTMTFVGRNFGTRPASAELFGPSGTFAATRSQWLRGRGGLILDDDTWTLRVQPGDFTVAVDVSFVPEGTVPLQLALAVANVTNKLTNGSITFDESSDQHGGVLFIETSAKASQNIEPVTIRAARAFKYSSVTTFTYRFSLSGVREQTRLELPLVGGESIESLSPDIAYTSADSAVSVTVSPGVDAIEVTGHFAQVPERLVKPAVLPFEQWLFDFDARHPVELGTDGVEIDPSEVAELAAGPRARAFFLVGSQALDITRVEVTLDKGRQGSARAAVEYVQGAGDHFVGSLRLVPSSAPDVDRIAVPTPAPPHFAAVADRPVRMFAQENNVSLRLASAEGAPQPISVQWREPASTNPALSVVSLRLPAQAIHLESEETRVALLPGYVPLAVLGAENASGDFIDGLHIYALLLAALAVVLARAARFRLWALIVTGVLFVGLYTVEDFPRTALLVLLAAAAVVSQLPERALMALQVNRWAHGLVLSLVLCAVAAALVPAALYMHDRVLSALHPWATGYGTSSSSSVLEQRNAALILRSEVDQATLDDQEAKKEEAEMGRAAQQAQQEQQEDRRRELTKGVPSGRTKGFVSGITKPPSLKAEAMAAEKTMRPVPFDPPNLPANLVSFSFGSLPPGESAGAHILVCGPALRALWVFAECVGLAALLALMVLRARRLWLAAVPRTEVRP